MSEIKYNSDAADYFKELPFYNKPIKKPKVKRLKNIDQLAELPLAELSAINKSKRLEGMQSCIKLKQFRKKIQLYN